jgi:fatty acid desaturase
MRGSWGLRSWLTLIAVCYTLGGWAAGVGMLTLPTPGLNALGVLLVAHTLAYSAYLIHDCVHHAVFKTTTASDRMGVLMSCGLRAGSVADLIIAGAAAGRLPRRGSHRAVRD